MRTLKYKTNIKCEGCKLQVANALNEIQGIRTWSVDLESVDKVLTLDVEDLMNESIIVSVVKEAGFRIELLKAEYIS